MSTDNKKNDDELSDFGDDFAKQTADFVKNKDNQKAISESAGVAIALVAGTAKAAYRIASVVVMCVYNVGKWVKDNTGSLRDYTWNHTKKWWNNLGKELTYKDEFGGRHPKLPTGPKGYFNVLAFPAAFTAAIWTATFAATLPVDTVKAGFAAMRDDPIYMMNKAEKADMTVAAQFIEDEDRELTKKYLLRFNIPDNSWYDLTYAISNVSLVGYDPEDEVVSMLNTSDNKVCAINTTFKSAYLFKAFRPSILGEPVCKDTFEELKEYLEKDVVDPKTGEVTKEGGEVYEQGGFYYYDSNPGTLDYVVRTGDSILSGIFGAVSWAVEGVSDLATGAWDMAFGDDEEAEQTEENKDADADKTTSVQFNNATNGYISNDNQDVTLTASISIENGPKMKVA
ncbi:MAG: hypothetical protein NZ828_12005 [Alphaproteobacteria bacterium]|nr:hypothetical protein [Alphaproteobacteria bacterium]